MESSLSLDEALLVELTCMECYSRVEEPVAVPHAEHEEQEGISLYCRKCVDSVKRRRRQVHVVGAAGVPVEVEWEDVVAAVHQAISPAEAPNHCSACVSWPVR